MTGQNTTNKPVAVVIGVPGRRIARVGLIRGPVAVVIDAVGARLVRVLFLRSARTTGLREAARPIFAVCEAILVVVEPVCASLVGVFGFFTRFNLTA